MTGFWSALRPLPPRLPDVHAQRLAGWVEMLDVDLDLAQRMLRLPPARMPLPPLALPAWGTAPAVDAPDPDEVAAVVVPPAKVALRGAYARRARGG